MKQFIVLMAVLPIMLLFMAQFTLDQINGSKIALAEDIIYAAKEEAKQQGGFDVTKLRNDLAEALGADASLIEIQAPTPGTVPRKWPDGSRGIIEYSVKIPVGDVMAGKAFLGMDDDKIYGFVIGSCAPSEYLP